MASGERGPAVASLQQSFIDLGLVMPRSTKNGIAPPDGIFGTETRRVVRGFQRTQGIGVDGIVGRRTLGELDGLLSGRTPPGTRPSGTDIPGVAPAVGAIDVSPPSHQPCGLFDWQIDWTTTGRNGYIVQEITNTYAFQTCDGTPQPSPATPHYWEAWRVQADGSVHPEDGTPDDTWRRPEFPGHTGSWSMAGDVFFVDQLDPAAGFQFANVPDAGNLWSTTTAPGNLGPTLLTRRAGGSWDCCDENRTHEPA